MNVYAAYKWSIFNYSYCYIFGDFAFFVLNFFFHLWEVFSCVKWWRYRLFRYYVSFNGDLFSTQSNLNILILEFNCFSGVSVIFNGCFYNWSSSWPIIIFTNIFQSFDCLIKKKFLYKCTFKFYLLYLF